MTRKEEIERAGMNWFYNTMNQDADVSQAFDAGAEWADRTPHWISVEDELPKEYIGVLVAISHAFCYTAFYCDGKWFSNDNLNMRELHSVTHWMSLPAPPKEDCKKFDMKGYENVIIHEGNTKGGVLK